MVFYNYSYGFNCLIHKLIHNLSCDYLCNRHFKCISPTWDRIEEDVVTARYMALDNLSKKHLLN